MKELLYVFLSIPSICLSQNINDGLIGYWPFNENSNDVSGNNNHFSVIDASLTTGINDNVNSAYLFNESENYLISENINRSTKPIAISIWCKPSNFGIEPGWLINQRDNSVGDQFQISINRYNTNFVLFYDARDPVVLSGPPLSTNNWHHLVMQSTGSNGDKFEAWINNQYVGHVQLTNDINYANSEPITLGIRGWNLTKGQYYGKIDELRVYNRTLSAEEISELFNFSNVSNSQCSALYCDGQNIGIGTSNTQGYKLAVAGDIITEKVKVATQSNWPDYVFDENYNLQNLQQLEKYIKTHGHLPNIPDAETIKEEGLDLGEMNAKLLEKIEELSLYIIEQGKINRSQDRENQKLKGKIEVLEEQNEQLRSINKVYNEKFQLLEDRLKELENR